MVAVADSSSLIALSICNHLNLLDMLFDKAIVPEAVYKVLSTTLCKFDKMATMDAPSLLELKPTTTPFYMI